MKAAEYFPNRVLGGFMRRVGSFPVRRRAHDLEALATADAVLARDGLIVIYPEGGVTKHAEISAKARPGVGAVALRNGARVVPVAIHPATHLHRWGFLRLPKITVQFGAPIEHPREDEPTRERAQDATDRIWTEIVAVSGSVGVNGARSGT